MARRSPLKPDVDTAARIARGHQRSVSALVADLLAYIQQRTEAGQIPEKLADDLNDAISWYWHHAAGEHVDVDTLLFRGSPTPCDDCATDVLPFNDDGFREPGEWFMVDDDVWRQATDGDAVVRHLCIGCLEHRLGRQLTSADFPAEIPLNQADNAHTPRLADRLGTSPE